VLVVNLFGPPGAGKSTGAAYVFAKLKMAGVNAELVTEFAKDKVWEESKGAFENQAYIFGEQYFRISRLNGKVDVVVTDSPILLSGFYNSDDVIDAELDAIVGKAFDTYKNFNVYVERTKPYNPVGRLHSEAESDEIDVRLTEFLIKHGVTCRYYSGTQEGYDVLVSDILKELGENSND